MLKVKLFRVGKKGQPSYRIVVSPDRAKRGGKYIALLGTYNPLTDPATIKLDKKSYASWLEKGAKPTDTVRRLAAKA